VFLNEKNWGFEFECVQKGIPYESIDKKRNIKRLVHFDTTEWQGFSKIKRFSDFKGDVIRLPGGFNDIPYITIEACKK